MPADDTGAAALRAAIDAVILSRHGLRAWLPPVENPPSTRGDAIRLWGNGPEVAMWAAWRDAVMLERAVKSMIALSAPPQVDP